MDLRQLKRVVLSQGATWEMTKRSHIIVRLHGKRICTIPSTASDTRSMRNTIAQLRNRGVDIPRK